MMADRPPDTVEKIMGLDIAEFRRSLARLSDAPEAGTPDGADKARQQFDLAHGDGKVVLTVQAMPPQTLGTLVTLPRTRVLIDLSDLPEADDRHAFLARFDRAFQRGGG